MLQTLDPSITTLTDRFGEGLSLLEQSHRWFIVAVLASHMISWRSFAAIVPSLDPDRLISQEVYQLLYELDDWTPQQITALLKAIAAHLTKE
jgi:hypothetical protein